MQVVDDAFRSSHVDRRRLEYGKWKTAKIDVGKNMKCAEAAHPGSLDYFGYSFHEAGIEGGKSLQSAQRNSTFRRAAILTSG